MKEEFIVDRAVPYSAGVTVLSDSIRIKTVLHGKNSNGMLLYPMDNSSCIKIDFPESSKNGTEYCCSISNIDSSRYTYLFHEDGEPRVDACAKAFTGHRFFGEEHAELASDSLGTCRFVCEDAFQWNQDKRPNTSYENSIYYGLHVRGFTRDPSSKIKEAGTFQGMQKKIPYLTSLGVTGVVLQPIYEFEECMLPDKKALSGQEKGNEQTRINYWGYESGYYFAPKNAYAYTDNAVQELKSLIQMLHKNNMEIILQFFFQNTKSAKEMVELLEYWAVNYHIDGFQIVGEKLPMDELINSPVLQDRKIWGDCIPSDITQESGKRLAKVDYQYMYAVRKFLKGDDDSLHNFLYFTRNADPKQGNIKFLAFHEGLRLADAVTYDVKHNESNGENNKDGSNYNCSWNCGIEGPTKKKAINTLRMKQMKNALLMLLTSQETPYIFMGDECGKTGQGNNNPYCQDNEITWMQWNLKKNNRELLEFTKALILFRKKHNILHMDQPLRIMDYKSCGYPDLSYHGKEAWKPEIAPGTKNVGLMYYGPYYEENGKKDDILYIAYNMHWDMQQFALPKLPKNFQWDTLCCTDESDLKQKAEENIMTLSPRSTAILWATKSN